MKNYKYSLSYDAFDKKDFNALKKTLNQKKYTMGKTVEKFENKLAKWLNINNADQLRVLDLGNNNLMGGIPEEITYLLNLEELNLESNTLGGDIPEELGNLTELFLLRISCP